LDGDRLRTEAGLDVVEAAEIVRAGLVHLVGEDDARDAILVALAPYGLGLRLDAPVGVEHAYRAVEDAQRKLHLDGEIDVPGGVDDVETLLTPEGSGRRRRYGDAALLLLLHPVHGGCALMDLAHLVGFAGIKEDPLGRGGLAGIDVGHDAEVPVVLDFM